jgi:DNA gyrase subunit A
VLFFSNRGVVYRLPAYRIPTASRNARGVPVVQLLPIPREEKITSVVGVDEFSEDEYLVMLTNNGFIKKTALAAFSNIRTNGLIAISLEEGDQLRWVRRARVDDSIIIASRMGMAIHFRTDHDQLRPLGRATRGVRSMNLRSGDELIGMDILPSNVVATVASSADDEELETPETEEAEELVINTDNPGPWALVVTTCGFGKRVPVTQFRLQNRAGKGLTAIKFKSRNAQDQMASLRIVEAGMELMIVTSRGVVIRQAVGAIPSQSRSATGVRLQRLDEDDAIVAITLVPESNAEDEQFDAIDVEAVEGDATRVTETSTDASITAAEAPEGDSGSEEE